MLNFLHTFIWNSRKKAVNCVGFLVKHKRLELLHKKKKGKNMAKVVWHVVIDTELCKGCELCIQAWPEKTLKLSDSINKVGYQYAVMANDNCTGCASCSLMCPDAVITVYRKVNK